MTQNNFFLVFLLFLSLLLSACETLTESEDVITDNDRGEYFLYLTLSTDIFSKSGETADASAYENKISSIDFFFYRNGTGEPEFVKNIRVEPEDDERVIALKYTTDDGRLPDFLKCRVNFNEEASTEYFTPAEGFPHGLPMSSSFYFTSAGAPVAATVLSRENFTNGIPADVFIDRAMAKAALSLDKDFAVSPVKAMAGNEEVLLTAVADGWGLTATDRTSYIFKNTGDDSFSDLNTALGTNGLSWTWSHSDLSFPLLHWAYSPNYSLTDFPHPGDPDNNLLCFPLLSELKANAFSADSPATVYIAETTRPETVFNKRDALPLVVMAAHYEATYPDGSSAPAPTFFRSDNKIFFEENHTSELAKRQNILYKQSSTGIEKPDADEFAAVTTLRRPEDAVLTAAGYDPEKIGEGFVSPQLKNDLLSDILLTDSRGNIPDLSAAEEVTEINVGLLLSCGLWEKYDDGICIFTFPVTHLRNETATGHYGIVRNHFYDMTLISIAGWGRGVADKNSRIGDPGTPADVMPVEINVDLKVGDDWIHVSADDVILEED